MIRFDDHVRSERYFTATLLPIVLFGDGLRGLRLFLELVEGKAATERGVRGDAQPKRLPTYEFQNVEVITEFHIARDLKFGGLIGAEVLLPSEETGERDRRDAPDLAVVAGRELVVCEAKFFVGFTAAELNQQLGSQRRQIAHLFSVRPDLRAYCHVALVPEKLAAPLECDAVLTWAEIADLSEAVLGASHYVTQRLLNAVQRYTATVGEPGIRNYDGVLPLASMIRKCEEFGASIFVGHTGGEADLRAKGLLYAQGKSWKWRDPRTNAGTAEQRNWMSGRLFLEVISSLPASSSVGSPIDRALPNRNYDGVLALDEVLRLCAERGDEILVGHTGGEQDLRNRRLAYVRGKRWKWRDPKANRGVVQSANWIRGNRFADIIHRCNQSETGNS